MARLLDDFAAYRRADVRFHVGLAEATGSTALVAAMTEAQGAMTDLICLHRAPARGARVVQRAARAAASTACSSATRRWPCAIMADHLRGTEHVLAGLLP